MIDPTNPIEVLIAVVLCVAWFVFTLGLAYLIPSPRRLSQETKRALALLVLAIVIVAGGVGAYHILGGGG